ncbi:MAG: hypothetical protein ACRYFS_20295 [Janthinobacterium lividum]
MRFSAAKSREHFLLSLLDEAILFGDMDPISDDDPEELAASIAGIQRGLDDFAAGRHRPAEQVFKEMKARHGTLGRFLAREGGQ